MSSQEERLGFNEKMIAEFREHGGTMPSMFGDAPVLLLHTTGAKSGERRIAPMMYQQDDADPDRVYVFASNGGRDTDPAWVHNVRAKADGLEVEIGTEKVEATAEILDEPRRSEVYAEQARRFDAFAKYEAGTSRTIPVVALSLHGRRT